MHAMAATDADHILESFELAAERAGDITEEVYRRYYENCPESAEIMSHVDVYMQGRMMNEVLNLVMTDPDESEQYLAYETRNHASWGVRGHMYVNLLQAVRDTVRAAVGDDWNQTVDAAWQNRIDHLLRTIEAASPPEP